MYDIRERSTLAWISRSCDRSTRDRGYRLWNGTLSYCLWSSYAAYALAMNVTLHELAEKYVDGITTKASNLEMNCLPSFLS